MKRCMVVGVTVLLMVAAALTACSSVPKVTWELRVSGAVANPLTLSYRDLAERELATLEDVLMERSQGEDSTNTWEGVSLAELLEEADASDGATVVVFRASDGYEREIPLGDLGQAVVALKQDGTWLADDKWGPIRLVVPGLPGSHWVGQLVEIEIVE